MESGDELSEFDCGHDHSDDEVDAMFAAMAQHPANQITDPGQEEVVGRMAYGDERFELIRSYNDSVAMAALATQQATAQCIFQQGQVRAALAGAIRGATVATLAIVPFVAFRLIRR